MFLIWLAALSELIFINRVDYQSPAIAALERNSVKLVFVHERP